MYRPDNFNCHVCKGECSIIDRTAALAGRIEYLTCPECHGSGMRPLDQEMIDTAIWCHDWLGERINDIFKAYCSHRDIRGGIDAYEIGHEQISITYGLSIRGCYDQDTLQIPSRYLAMEDFQSAIRADYEAEQEVLRVQKEKQEAENRRRREEQERALYESLRNKFEASHD